MEKTKEAIKKQFNKKRQNSQRLKQGDSVWLEVKNIQLNQPLKKLNQKNINLLKSQRILNKKCFS